MFEQKDGEFSYGKTYLKHTVSKAIHRTLYYIAAIDHKLIEKCPRVDRILAVQLGVSLILTFLIISCTMYFSLSYIDGNSISYDHETKVYSLITSDLNYYKLLGFILISSVVGVVVVLFDRILFMSDWYYYSNFFENKKVGWNTIKNGSNKALRIFVRLSISVAMAYALSTFLELKIFESKILEQMQISHYSLNKKKYYDVLDKEIDEKKAEISSARTLLSELTKKLAILAGGGVVIGKSNFDSNDLDDKAISIKNTRIKEDKRLRNASKAEQKPLLDQLKQLSGSIGALANNLGRAKGCARVEQTGSNPRNLTCDAIDGAGKGKRFNEWMSLVDQLSTRLASQKTQKDTTKTQLTEVQGRLVRELASLRSGETDELSIIKSQKRIGIQRKSKRYEESLAQRKTDLETLPSKITKQKKIVDALVKSYGPAVERAKATILSPSLGFKPFRDGPLDRMIALTTLRGDKVYGKQVTMFSWWVKGFLIFLEVVPVLAKMFFSPPTGYSQLIQNKLRYHSTQASADVESLSAMIDLEKDISDLKTQLRQEIVSREIAESTLNDVIEEMKKNTGGPSKSSSPRKPRNPRKPKTPI